MNIKEIRNMDDRQLYTFLNGLSSRNGVFCIRCGEKTTTFNRKTINVGVYDRGYQRQKKLCNLCKSCYSDLLDYLAVLDPTDDDK